MKRISRRGFRAVIIMCIITFAIGLFTAMMKPVSAQETADDSTMLIANENSDTFSVDYGDNVVDYDLSDGESAHDYVDSYADNLSADKNFETNVSAAIDKVREETPAYATWLSLLAPVVAIALALITKEVYSSLVIGIIVGGLIYAGGNLELTLTHVISEGFIANLADSYNMGIIFFLVILGSLVAMMNKAGGSAAFGRWATSKIKTRVGAQCATIALGILIFIDDYFNCLTVGSVMRPVTDKHNISRAKLAYIIDATAAPVCIIAPISSWAAAVAGFANAAGAENGIALFIEAIPYNFYALLTILMMFFLAFTNVDYGPMAVHEKNATEKGDLFTSGGEDFDQVKEEISSNGKVMDLVLPVLVLIVSAIGAMIYTGFLGGATDIVTAFSGCDAETSLIFATMVTVFFMMILYLPRKVVTFKGFMDSFVEGFKMMIPAIAILIFAWSLKGMGDALEISTFVKNIVGSNTSASVILPAILFVVAVFLSFSTGTSWGTFAILVPIAIAMFPGSENLQMMIISVSAVLAGAVCGDHISPISDTTVMSSAGAQSNHINHVTTQMQYAAVVTVISFIGYIIAGFIHIWWVVLGISLILLLITLTVIKKISLSKDEETKARA